MDPITAFAAAQASLAMIRKGVEFYKQCKAAAADVSEITSEVSGNIGKFMDSKEVVSEAARKAKEQSEIPPEPGKMSNLNSQALNNVMMQIQLENAEKELREMLVYHTPGLGAVWTRFEKERERLLIVHQRVREEAEKRQKEEIAKARVNAAIRNRKLRKTIREVQEAIAWSFILIFLVFIFNSIVEYRIAYSPELGRCFIPKGTWGYEWYNNLRFIDCEIPINKVYRLTRH